MLSTQHAVQILLESAGQTPLTDGTLCSATPSALATLGLIAGDQVRIIRNTAQGYALYTIIRTPHTEVSDDIVRMTNQGLKRLDAVGDFEGILDTRITRSLTEDQARMESEFIEQLDETDAKHRGLVVCAPHGGDIEPHTDELAEGVFAMLRRQGKGVSCWRCKGWKQRGGAHERWHITSTQISPRSFPLLGQIAARGFGHALAFHGCKGKMLLIGGRALTGLKDEIAQALRVIKGLERRVRVAQPGSAYGGGEQANLVNWLTARGAGGVQIELPLDVRTDVYFRGQIARVMASVFAARL